MVMGRRSTMGDAVTADNSKSTEHSTNMEDSMSNLSVASAGKSNSEKLILDDASIRFNQLVPAAGTDLSPLRTSPKSKRPSRNLVLGPVTKLASLASNAVVASGSAVGGVGMATGKAVIFGTKGLVEGTGKAVVGGSKAIVEGTTNTVVLGGKAVVGGGKAIVEGTGKAVVVGGQAVVGGGKAIVEGTTNTVVYGSKAIVEGTTNTVVYGGKAVVGGGKAIVGGTTTVAAYSGKTVVKGAKGVVKGIKKASKASVRTLLLQKKKMSKWEEGLEVIDELLDPECVIYHSLNPEQRRKLASVKSILLKGPTNSDENRTQHIPQQLMQLQQHDGDEASVMGLDDSQDFGQQGGGSGGSSGGRKRLSRSSRANRRNGNNFILQEFAGVKSVRLQKSQLAPLQAEEEEEEGSPSAHQGPANTDVAASTQGGGLPPAISEKQHFKTFVPPEFATLLSRDEKLEVSLMLSWDSINQWDFNVFRLHEVSHGHPLLFMVWAVLGAPYAQQAMSAELGLDDNHDNGDNGEHEPRQGYKFVDELKIPPEKLCNYARAIEGDYNADNPYHNAIHAADVLQSLHVLIQVSKEEDFMRDCPSDNLFAILLAAAVHDVDHPGKTNAFHVQLKSELALRYNDRSVLENWHVAHAFARMLDVDLGGKKNLSASQLLMLTASAQSKRNINDQDSPNNILCNVTKEQFAGIRKHVIEAVLQTDMTGHFESVNSVKGMLLDDEEAEDATKREGRTWRLLMFMLHLADISGQAKGPPLFKLWTDRCMDEFFKQGDLETKLGLPVSPNCDRATTVLPVSQMGFIEFVVEPSYAVLANFIPYVEEHVVPLIHKNLEYWMEQQEMTNKEESSSSPDTLLDEIIEEEEAPASPAKESSMSSEHKAEEVSSRPLEHKPGNGVVPAKEGVQSAASPSSSEQRNKVKPPASSSNPVEDEEDFYFT